LPPGHKPVNIDIGKIMILLPHTMQMIEEIAPGEKRTVKFQAVRHAHRKQKKVTRGDKPGKSVEKPHSQSMRKINCYFIRKFFHKLLYKSFNFIS
jgi:hypothetical protein